MNPVRILLFIFVTTLSAQRVTGQPESLPPYEKVYHHFFATYNEDTLDLGTRSYLHFARRPTGWYVQLEDIHARKVTSEQPLWDPTKDSWSKLDSPFVLRKSPVDPDTQYPYYAADSPFFALNLYYGYRGWEDDVIRTLEPVGVSLADRQLYQLGRAWTSLADDALW